MKSVRISLAPGRPEGLLIQADPDEIDALVNLSEFTERTADGLIYADWDRQHLGAWLEDWMRRGVRIILDYEELT